MLTKHIKPQVFFGVVFAVALFFGTAIVAMANPSFFMVGSQTATASSTLAYMTPGTATTTLPALDTYAPGTNTKANGAFLAFQYTASGTAPVLNARVEYSNNNQDWYPDGFTYVPEGPTYATTTIMTTPAHNYSWTLSTTTEAIGSGTATRVHQSLALTEIPARYVRVIFTVPQGGGNGGLWAVLVPFKERNE